MPRALVIEDDPRVLRALTALIERQGFAAATARTFAEARSELRRQPADVVVVDVCLPDGSGLDLLLEIPARDRPQVLLISGEDSVRRAVQDMALRTVHFLQKPVEPDRVVELLRDARRGLPGRQRRRRRAAARLLGRSSAMQEVHDLIAKVAPTDFPVYVEGESGTGKELVAEAIHRGSRRARQPFVAINCGALPDTLIDSELFGHEKGAFTGATVAKKGVFEQADGGTLFLDEITEMAPEMQVRLLRVLETSRLRRIGGTKDVEVDVRIVAASNRQWEEAVADERLREDLFHRLCVFPIHLRPLRERVEDIEILARHFLAAVAEGEGRQKTMHPSFIDGLKKYPWPGNVRELRNAVQRAYIVAGDEITDDALPPHMTAGEAAPAAGPRDEDTIELPVGSTIAEAERALIEATLEEHEGDKRATASTLGISLRTLYNRLRDYEAGATGEPGAADAGADR